MDYMKAKKDKGKEQCCFLCGRTRTEIGDHPLPIMQRAHLLPNRLTGAKKRYGGVKNALNAVEWEALLREIGPELDMECSDTHEQLRLRASAYNHELCGECHEEVLSEPVYFPSVMKSLKKHFRNKQRIEKILLLAKVLKLGTEALDNEDRQDG
jgi:hypothetical protein